MAHYMVHVYKKKVIYGACDTFRAEAQAQLALWSEALNIEIVAGKDKGDPAAVAFDTVSRAKARNVDLVLIYPAVLDATTGQNELAQAKAFHQATPITGIILTKLDGLTRGGTLFATQISLKIPVKFIGIGEKPADLIPFGPELFVQSMLSVALLLGTIQEFIEFFPIYSSGHILLYQILSGFVSAEDRLFDAFVKIGSGAEIACYFVKMRKKIGAIDAIISKRLSILTCYIISPCHFYGDAIPFKHH
ncbi:hypothetical protein ACTFIW_013301 [Dictyostelium discoideum]